MAQSNFNLPNTDGATFRANNNDAHQAHATWSSGSTAPSTTYPYQVWVDTANQQLKRRNSSNTSWIVEAELDGTNPIRYDASQNDYTPDFTGATTVNLRDELDRRYVTPQMFGAVGDGTTDDTMAIQAAVDAVQGLSQGGVVYLPPSQYLITNTITISSSAVSVIGAGRRATEITAVNADFDLLNFDGGGTALQNNEVRGIRFFTSLNATAGAQVRMDDVIEGTIEGCEFSAFYVGIELVGANRIMIINNVGSQQNRVSGSGFAGLLLTSDGDSGVCSGNNVIGFELNGGGPSTYSYTSGIELKSSDGFYASNLHINRAEYDMRIIPDDVNSNHTVASILIENFYFDASGSNGLNITGTASTAYSDIQFGIGQIRAAQSHGIYSDPSSQVTNFKFGGTIRSSEYSGFYCNNGKLNYVTLDGCLFDENNKSDSGQLDVRQDGSHWLIDNCRFRRGGATGTVLSVNGSNVNVNGGDVSQTSMGTKFIGTFTARGVRGWKTKATGIGTIASGNSATVVSHGLDVTPSISAIQVTARNTASIDELIFDSVTSTDFAVRATPAPSGDLDFSWMIDTEV